MLVDTLVNCEWMLRRLRRGEAQFWKFKDEKTFTKTDYPEGRILDYGDKVYDRLQRRLNSIHRNYHRALNEPSAWRMPPPLRMPSPNRINHLPPKLASFLRLCPWGRQSRLRSRCQRLQPPARRPAPPTAPRWYWRKTEGR
jgi:hypothetical protein